jgi:3-phenylpropionate/trans-cinnamate dioxygenase ferredoxin reductase subunit
MSEPIIIVGAGQASASCAAKLRALGYDGPLVIIGEETAAPYQRPPLSKKYVSGELALERLFVRPLSWYQEETIDLKLGTRVTALHPTTHEVELGDGSRLKYRDLVLTTGSRPRRLPAAVGGDLAGVYTVRDLADADAIAPTLKPGARLLVVGGGYIGLEAAAVAAQKGLQVTVLEMADRILQRVAAAPTSDFFRALHQSHGVTIREKTGLTKLVGKGGRLTGAELADGSFLPVDVAIVGIGILPNDELAKAAGIAVEAGILVDGQGRTSDPHVFAAGDCANFPWRGERTRLESVQNAIDQAEHVAAVIMGETKDYDPKPWFWSDQYDIKLQIAGLNRGYDSTVLRPGKRPGSQSIWYFKDGRLVAIDAMNEALAYALGKKALEAGKSAEPAVLANPNSDLKTIFA